MNFIEIWDTNNGASIDFLYILKTINVESNLTWAILDLEAVASERGTFSMIDLESKIEKAATGLVMTGAEIIKIAEQLFQIVNGKFVAYRDIEDPELVIESVDSSYWTIYSPDSRVLEKLSKTYKLTKSTTISEPPL